MDYRLHRGMSIWTVAESDPSCNHKLMPKISCFESKREIARTSTARPLNFADGCVVVDDRIDGANNRNWRDD